MSSTTKRWPLVLAALFAALALVETGAAVLASSGVATDEEWRAAADEVRAGYAAGDLIVFAPAWSDQVGRRWLGDLMPRAMVGRSDDRRFGRVWVVSIRGARYPDAPSVAPELAHAHGHVGVTRFAHAAEPVTADLTALLGEARVTQVALPAGALEAPADGRSDETPCFSAPQDRDAGFQCATTHVGRRTLEIDYRPRLGVLVPVDGARVTRLEWPAVKLGESLRLYAGLHDYYARKTADGAVHVRLVADGQTLLAGDVHNADGWKAFTVDTRALRGQTHALRVEVSSRAPAWRNFGFTVEVGP